ncbi:MAG: carboxypeptidase-like regulatory domain-containing protein [Oscillospiraceae bacterium]|nr:carboxypeptidase-like regulatory domain-containing protein [Oscillospiraceae bacterium]
MVHYKIQGPSNGVIVDHVSKQIVGSFDTDGIADTADVAENIASGIVARAKQSFARAYALEITVTGSSGALSGATVTVSSPYQSRSGITDVEGKYICYVPDAAYSVSVSREGYTSGTGSAAVNGADISVTISMSEA